MIRIVTLACLSLAVAGAAAAEEPVAGQAVAYRSADLDTPLGARELQQRIDRAARNVCRVDAPRSTATRAQEDTCRGEAIARAVDTVGATKLAAARQQGPLVARGGASN
jgi:UrcA family protein